MKSFRNLFFYALMLSFVVFNLFPGTQDLCDLEAAAPCGLSFVIERGNKISIQYIEDKINAIIQTMSRNGKKVNSGDTLDIILLLDFDGVLFPFKDYKKIDAHFAEAIARLKAKGLIVGGLTQRHKLCTKDDLPLFEKHFSGFNMLPGITQKFPHGTELANGVFYAREFKGLSLSQTKSHAVKILFDLFNKNGKKITPETVVIFADDMLERNLLSVGLVCIEHGIKNAVMIEYLPEYCQKPFSTTPTVKETSTTKAAVAA